MRIGIGMGGVAAVLGLLAAGCEGDASGVDDVTTDTAGEHLVTDVVEETDAGDLPADVVEEEAPGQDAPASILECGLPDRTFWTWDLSDMPPGDRQVDATCRGWGGEVAVYVEEGLWGTNMDEDDVVTLVTAFESSTPADPTRGIHDIVTSTFGDVPDVDGDGRVLLLFHSLGEYMGSSFDGFFRPQDETECATCNHAEMLFLDAVHNPVSEPYMLSIIAHELQHVVHWAADPDEHSWINESMSEASMALCGYYTDDAQVRAFTFEPDTSLVTTSHVDYGATFLFGLYLTERLGREFLADLVDEPDNGIAGFDVVAAERGLDMDAVFADWVVANFVDDPDLEDGRWGYSTYDTHGMAVEPATADGVMHEGTLNGWAADYNIYHVDAAATPASVRLDSSGWSSLGATAITFSSSDDTLAAAVSPIALSGESTQTEVPVSPSHDRLVLVVFALAAGLFDYSHSLLP
jgi:hypothetical protein